MEKKTTKTFGSRWGFLLSAVGSAVGMAKVWGFPAKMGGNGGAAFLIAYLIFIALFSSVGLAAEYAIGRRSRTGTVGASIDRFSLHRSWLRSYHFLCAESAV